MPLLLPETVLLHALCEVPEMDTVCPFKVHVMVQLEPLPPTEQVAPLADSLPQRHSVCPPVVALQQAGVLPPPEQPPTSAIPRATIANPVPNPLMRSSISASLRAWTKPLF